MPAIHPNWFYTSPIINSNLGFSTFSFPRSLTFSTSLSPSLEFISTEPNLFSFNRKRRLFVTVNAAAKSSRSDLYSVLNVSTNATVQEIKASYRKLSRKGLELKKSLRRSVLHTRYYQMMRKGLHMTDLARQGCEENMMCLVAVRRGSISGDLYLVIHVEEKRDIWRDGLNLYSKLDVDFTEAILGTVKKVTTVDGIKDLQIPPGCQPGEKIKMSKMGVPDMIELQLQEIIFFC